MNNKKELMFRTDIALEETARFNEELHGIRSSTKEYEEILVTKTIIDQSHDERINKLPGIYYNIDLSNIDIHNNDSAEKVIKVLANSLVDILKYKKVLDKKGMLVGLGNINVTPDSIGPYTLDNVIVTRHLFLNDFNNRGYSNISGYSPGVMGNTGIETKDIIEAIYNKVKADYLIVVDALATSKTERITKTIQITDSGISPGSGVGNKRKEISEQTIGVPVIAVGIPTVVDATTLTIDLMEGLQKYLLEQNNQIIKDINFFGLRDLLIDATNNTMHQMMVTPKEIDLVVEDLSKILAAGIDIAVHEKLRKSYLEE